MKKNPLVFINHINDEIDKISQSVKGVTKDKFIQNSLLTDATVRRLEIIGEAIKNIPNEFRKKYNQIEWVSFAGLRDKLIHHYFGVDLNAIWYVLKKDLPGLKKKIKEILKGDM